MFKCKKDFMKYSQNYILTKMKNDRYIIFNGYRYF